MLGVGTPDANPTPDDACRMVLRPRRALSSRQFVAVFAALVGGAGLVALFSFFQGNVYAPVFWLLDAAFVGATLRWCWRQGERREVVECGAREVTVTRATDAGGRAEALFTAHPYWTRLVVEDVRGSPRILFVSRGRRVEIGGFLGPAERRALADRLRDLLATAAGRASDDERLNR